MKKAKNNLLLLFLLGCFSTIYGQNAEVFLYDGTINHRGTVSSGEIVVKIYAQNNLLADRQLNFSFKVKDINLTSVWDNQSKPYAVSQLPQSIKDAVNKTAYVTEYKFDIYNGNNPGNQRSRIRACHWRVRIATSPSRSTARLPSRGKHPRPFSPRKSSRRWPLSSGRRIGTDGNSPSR